MALADEANQVLDEGLELRTGLAVIFVRVEAPDLFRRRHGIQATHATVGAIDQLGSETDHLEARPCLSGTTDWTGRNILHGKPVHIVRTTGANRTHRVLIQFLGGQKRTSLAESRGASCAAGLQRSRAAGRRPAASRPFDAAAEAV